VRRSGASTGAGSSLECQLGAAADTIAGLPSTADYARGHAAFGEETNPEFVGE
jgi:hypothetical protein